MDFSKRYCQIKLHIISEANRWKQSYPFCHRPTIYESMQLCLAVTQIDAVQGFFKVTSTVCYVVVNSSGYVII